MKIDIEDLTTVLVSARNAGNIEVSAAKKIVRDVVSKVYDRKAEIYLENLRAKKKNDIEVVSRIFSTF